MKKFIFTLFLLCGAVSFASAQDNAIGLRFGGSAYSFNVEATYQRALSDANRLQFDLGLGSGFFSASGQYQWTWNLPQLANGFAWHAGVGATLGAAGSSFVLGAIGQVGLEYTFNFPLQLGIDYRPALYFTPAFAFGWQGFALSARYKF